MRGRQNQKFTALAFVSLAFLLRFRIIGYPAATTGLILVNRALSGDGPPLLQTLFNYSNSIRNSWHVIHA